MAEIFRDDHGVYVPNFRNITLKPIQEDIYELVNRCNAAYLLISRRVGKTTALDCIYKDKIINQGPMMKRKFRYLATHPNAGELQSKFLDDWMLSSLGGMENIQNSINKVWIPLPKRFEEWLYPYGDKTTINKDLSNTDYEWFFDSDPKKKIIRLINNRLYVRLFKHPVGGNSSNRKDEVILKGEYFNGAIQELISANYNYGKYVRGKDIYGLWQEEIGTYKTNYMSQDALPAILSRNGWVISSFTPPAEEYPKEHWTYKEIVQPAIKLQGYKKVRLHGVDYYVYKNVSEGEKVITTYDENGKSKTHLEKISVTTTNMVAVGSLENCFYFGQGGIEEFLRIKGTLREKIDLKYDYDKKGNIIIDDEGMPQYKISHTGELNPGGQMVMEDYLREYCVSYEGSQKDNIMYAFGDHNIKPIDWLDFTQYPSLVGFDKGISEVDEKKGEIYAKKGQSVTIWVKVAKINNRQWVAYDEGVVDYSYQRYGEVWLENAKQGIPTIFENEMVKRGPKHSNGLYNNDLYQILQATPELRQSYAGGLYYKCLIPCLKRKNTVKINDYNTLLELDMELTDPVTGEQGGSLLYITENCTNLIEFLRDKWKYKKSTDGGRERITTREDFWDGLTYPIDTFLFDNKKKNIIKSIWNDPRYKGNQYQQKQYMRNGFVLNNYSNQPYLINSNKF